MCTLPQRQQSSQTSKVKTFSHCKLGMQGFEHNSSKQLRTQDSKLGNLERKEKENIGFHETRKEKPLFLGVFVFMSIKDVQSNHFEYAYV